jgi:hypothetical protein
MKSDTSSSEKKGSNIVIDFSNLEIVTMAVYILGGDLDYIDTEDIAIKANELAPRRFTWRKYPTQINIENVRAFLSDAKKIKNGKYLRGSGKRGWMLTSEGKAFAKKNAPFLKTLSLGRERLSTKERHWIKRERLRLLSSDVVRKCRRSGTESISYEEAESIFRLDSYVVGDVREKKIQRVLNFLGNDPEIGKIITELAQKVREGKK